VEKRCEKMVAEEVTMWLRFLKDMASFRSKYPSLVLKSLDYVNSVCRQGSYEFVDVVEGEGTVTPWLRYVHIPSPSMVQQI